MQMNFGYEEGVRPVGGVQVRPPEQTPSAYIHLEARSQGGLSSYFPTVPK